MTRFIVMIDFTEEQIQRYSRHILLKDVGVEGQEKIMNARVLVVGAGGLGAPVSLYLAAAGIGTIGIVDADVVDLSNLQRQVIHFTKDVGVPKVKSAEEKIKAINPDVKVETYYQFLDSSNALDIIREYDFIVDVDLTDRQAQTTTVTNTLSVTSQVHGQTYGNSLGLVDLVEVSVQQSIACGVELQLLDDSLVLRAVDVQVHYIYVWGIDSLTQFSSRCCESQCLGQTVLTLLLTIQIAGYQTLLAKQLRGLLACVGALLTVYINLFHN